MRLMQVSGPAGRQVVASDGDRSWVVPGCATVYQLALTAIESGATLTQLLARTDPFIAAEPESLLARGQVLAPIDHPDPAHMLITGTGLTHLGSAASRDAMHARLTPASTDALTDSMKMFLMGLRGGRPKAGEIGVQPEWFYKGDGSTVVAPGRPLVSPSFAADAGEEPEVAGVYVIGPAGAPHRLGYVLLNELSDHIIERENYLWLAHSKLRPCSFGPELLLGELPADIRGLSRIRRDQSVLFEQPFLTGEANMSHTLANLEQHHFKYACFRRPGDVHIHTFGTATLSFAAQVRTQPGDIFEIEAEPFGLPLRNPLEIGAHSGFTINSL